MEAKYFKQGRTKAYTLTEKELRDYEIRVSFYVMFELGMRVQEILGIIGRKYNMSDSNVSHIIYYKDN